MIVTRLKGGLGNQMFQYALGRRLAHDRRVPLRLDLSWFSDPEAAAGSTPRSYALGGLRISAAAATLEEMAPFARRRGLSGALRRGWGRLTLRPAPPRIRERGTLFDPRVLSAPSSAYLVGYWQSEKYFKSIEGILRKEFLLAAEPCDHARRILAGMQEGTAVALHVRRGDYVTSPRTSSTFPVCPPEYYREAAARLAGRAGGLHFYLFSDDPDWVRENLRLDHPSTVVTHAPGCPEHQDLFLMTRCRHHVIANSSFSWWGAWLSSGEGKIVIAPRRWYHREGIDTSDLVPESWVRL